MHIAVRQTDSWQKLLSQGFTDIQSLSQYLEVDAAHFSSQASADFAIKVPLPYAQRMKKGDLNDPLLKQVMPLEQETIQLPGYVKDPLAELQSNPIDGLIHKYKSRVLLILSGACAINCRYCFRRHFPYQENQIGPKQWQEILHYLASDPSIEEVIFSGGDPLATSDKRLKKMFDDLAAISHIKRLRIHSRLPVVIPQRITTELCHIFSASRLETIMVIHANHANEFDSAVKSAIEKMVFSGTTVFNQAVLLKGINDTLEQQKDLHRTSFSAKAIPYYLFVLDPVAGAAHFDITDREAALLLKQLQSELSGYLVPKLAREIPGQPNKTLLFAE